MRYKWLRGSVLSSDHGSINIHIQIDILNDGVNFYVFLRYEKTVFRGSCHICVSSGNNILWESIYLSQYYSSIFLLQCWLTTNQRDYFINHPSEVYCSRLEILRDLWSGDFWSGQTRGSLAGRMDWKRLVDTCFELANSRVINLNI